MKRIFIIAASLALVVAAFSCQKVEKEYNVPYVSTLDAKDITDCEAILMGSYSGLGGFNYGTLNMYFVISADMALLESYDRSREYGDEIIEVSGWEKDVFSSANYECDLSGLAPATTYYYFFAISDGYSEARGQIHSFTTDEVEPEIVDVTLYSDYYYSDGSVYYDIKVGTNVDLSSYNGDYGIWVCVRGKSGMSEEFYSCSNSGKVLTAEVRIPKDAFDIDNSSYYCTAEVSYCKIGIYLDDEVLCSERVYGITYENQPSIEIVSVKQGETQEINEDGWDTQGNYSYKLKLTGVMFMDEIYSYLIGYWRTPGRHEDYNIDEDGVTGTYSAWIKYTSSNAARTDYKQVRAMVGSREIVSDGSIAYDLSGSYCYIYLYTGYVNETSSVKSNAMRLSVLKDSADFSCASSN